MNTALTIVEAPAVTADPSKKTPPAQTFGAVASACPRCTAIAARRVDVTEWITMYRCVECGWQYAKAGGR
jgi:predicted RNA-binding Zn-ribbon protein involved in translation (DUF1610 family)